MNSSPLVSPAEPLQALDALTPTQAQDLRRQMQLLHCKWDVQIEDQATISPFPLRLTRATWRRLADWSEALAGELLDAEQLLIANPSALRWIGIDRRIRACLKPSARRARVPRLMRFDFHPTPDGWRISEVNADVPGGFSESSELPRLMLPHYPGCRQAGNPADDWCDAIAAACRPTPGSPTRCGLLTATGFMEDAQVTAYLAGKLHERRVLTEPINPLRLGWRDGSWVHSGRPLDAILRFYQAEWLTQRPRISGWHSFFAPDDRTQVLNTARAIVGESKRFTLGCRRRGFRLPTWETLLPETVDPRDADWIGSPRWIMKPAFGNTGDDVFCDGSPPARDRREIRARRAALRDIRRRPLGWIAQRRFEVSAITSPIGDIYPCLGVFVLDGRAVGIYGRYASHPLIDYRAVDVAVLIENGDG